jgi:hypothetical protein
MMMLMTQSGANDENNITTTCHIMCNIIKTSQKNKEPIRLGAACAQKGRRTGSAVQTDAGPPGRPSPQSSSGRRTLPCHPASQTSIKKKKKRQKNLMDETTTENSLLFL